MFAVIGSVLQLVALGYAFVGSMRERFFVGALAAVLRFALVIAAALMALRLRAVTPPGSAGDAGPAHAGLTVVALVVTVVGPILSFVVLWIAHRKTRGVSALAEERASRPYEAWLPAALSTRRTSFSTWSPRSPCTGTERFTGNGPVVASPPPSEISPRGPSAVDHRPASDAEPASTAEHVAKNAGPSACPRWSTMQLRNEFSQSS